MNLHLKYLQYYFHCSCPLLTQAFWTGIGAGAQFIHCHIPSIICRKAEQCDLKMDKWMLLSAMLLYCRAKQGWRQSGLMGWVLSLLQSFDIMIYCLWRCIKLLDTLIDKYFSLSPTASYKCLLQNWRMPTTIESVQFQTIITNNQYTTKNEVTKTRLHRYHWSVEPWH